MQFHNCIYCLRN